MRNYRISIGKEFDQYLKSWFEDCMIEEQPGVTFLYCELTDQAEIFGILQRIQSLGLPLIEAVKIEN